jgi:hypothetical protein
MSAGFWFFVGAAILLAVLALAYRRWWSRLNGVGAAARHTLILSTIGGLIGAVFWWQDVDVSFAWNLPPLASRMLGAAATAFGLAGLYALERPTPARVRLHALMVAVYLIPLSLAAITLHLDRFDFSAPVSWGFFAAVGVLSVSSVAALATERGREAREPVSAAQSFWLLAAGAVLAACGLALFAVPATAFPLVFNWPSDPLTSRLIAAMLLTLAAIFLVARRNARLLPQAHILGAAYGLGVVVAIMPNILRGLPWPPLYLVAFAVLGVVSTVFPLAGRRA